MGAAFNDPTLVHHQDLVCFLNGGQTVGYDDGSSAFRQFFRSGLDQGFGFGIDRGSSFIQDEDLGIVNISPEKGNQLSLPNRQASAPFIYFGMVTLGQ